MADYKKLREMCTSELSSALLPKYKNNKNRISNQIYKVWSRACYFFTIQIVQMLWNSCLDKPRGLSGRRREREEGIKCADVISKDSRKTTTTKKNNSNKMQFLWGS